MTVTSQRGSRDVIDHFFNGAAAIRLFLRSDPIHLSNLSIDRSIATKLSANFINWPAWSVLLLINQKLVLKCVEYDLKISLGICQKIKNNKIDPKMVSYCFEYVPENWLEIVLWNHPKLVKKILENDQWATKFGCWFSFADKSDPKKSLENDQNLMTNLVWYQLKMTWKLVDQLVKNYWKPVEKIMEKLVSKTPKMSRNFARKLLGDIFKIGGK